MSGAGIIGRLSLLEIRKSGRLSFRELCFFFFVSINDKGGTLMGFGNGEVL